MIFNTCERVSLTKYDKHDPIVRQKTHYAVRENKNVFKASCADVDTTLEKIKKEIVDYSNDLPLSLLVRSLWR